MDGEILSSDSADRLLVLQNDERRKILKQVQNDGRGRLGMMRIEGGEVAYVSREF